MAMKTNRIFSSLSFTFYHSLNRVEGVLKIFDAEVMIDREGFHAVGWSYLRGDKNFVFSGDEEICSTGIS